MKLPLDLQKILTYRKVCKRTLPKFDVEKGKLIETQVEKTGPRFGIDRMGNLKATVKNASN